MKAPKKKLNENPSLDEPSGPSAYWTKRVLNLEEVIMYTGYSKCYILKLAINSVIPHSRPTGGAPFFEGEKLENCLLSNPIKTVQAIDKEAANRIVEKPIKAKRNS
ncbi:hypothetical protein [Dyadobacter sp. CY323]|uniref:hypothetical protein n=1 Tax=Dyadobacter sp. CY323 TaxID=2907302 RepID=UPI001F180552|nr:hypothetical protein [Dyadobacter sp. CY323]MCE6992123.1 hypothetical protein [Dyadobacter sp. CY323]